MKPALRSSTWISDGLVRAEYQAVVSALGGTDPSMRCFVGSSGLVGVTGYIGRAIEKVKRRQER